MNTRFLCNDNTRTNKHKQDKQHNASQIIMWISSSLHRNNLIRILLLWLFFANQPSYQYFLLWYDFLFFYLFFTTKQILFILLFFDISFFSCLIASLQRTPSYSYSSYLILFLLFFLLVSLRRNNLMHVLLLWCIYIYICFLWFLCK